MRIGLEFMEFIMNYMQFLLMLSVNENIITLPFLIPYWRQARNLFDGDVVCVCMCVGDALLVYRISPKG